MRPLAFVAAVYATTVGTSSALVDPEGTFTVYVEAAGYDHRTSGNGCSPDGCKPYNTRDGDLSSNSRWSCQGDDLSHRDGCWIEYSFEEPLDLVEMRIAFYKGDENTRTLEVYGGGGFRGTITSSGETDGFQTFPLDDKNSGSVRLKLADYEEHSQVWLSIKEVQLLVETLPVITGP